MDEIAKREARALIWNWLKARLAERSTWLGLISVLVALGLQVSPDLQSSIVSAGLGLGGLVAALTRDKH